MKNASFKFKSTFFLIFLFGIFGLAESSWAACQRVGTTCYPGSQASPTSSLADVQDCVSNDAQAGDTVSIPAGNPTWSGPLQLTNKNIEVKGPTCTVDRNGRPTSCPLTITLTGVGFCPGGVWGQSAGVCISTTGGTDGTSSSGMAVKKVSWRLHDMAFTGTPPDADTYSILQMMAYQYDYPVMGWRIDHIKMDFPAMSHLRFIITAGINWGLIDHVSFNGRNTFIYQIEMLGHEYDDAVSAGVHPYQSFEGNYIWSLPLHLGSDEALYLEDSTLTNTAVSSVANDMAAGASIVMRHNIFSGPTALYSHTGEGGILGRGGARKYEFYNNQCDGNGLGFEWIGMQEDGTGVIFNNKVTGYGLNKVWPSVFRADTYYDYTNYFYGNCWGPANFNYGGGALGSHDGNIESNGWPCLDQIGRGLINGCTGANCSLTAVQDSVPLYLWNNGPQDKCYDSTASGADCDNSADLIPNEAGGTKVGTMADYIKTTPHTNGDKDYCVIPKGTNPIGYQCGNHTLRYTAFEYPHPLQGGTDNTAPAPPSGLVVR